VPASWLSFSCRRGGSLFVPGEEAPFLFPARRLSFCSRRGGSLFVPLGEEALFLFPARRLSFCSRRGGSFLEQLEANISIFLAFVPCVTSFDGFVVKDANFCWVMMLSEFNIGTAALCQAVHPCQSTTTPAVAPPLSWVCAPVACGCFAALDGFSAVLPLFRYIQDP
jgi:hypothetical protein